MKVLLAGLGRWGEEHLRVLGELGVEIWVADPDPDRRALALRAGPGGHSGDPGLPAGPPHVDALDVVTPADSHLVLAAAALRIGKPCFVEKPLALTVVEAEEIAAIVEATGGLLQVGHVFRFHPVTDVVRRHLDAGEVGRIRYATARFAGFKRPRADLGVTGADALHCFDLLAHLLRTSPCAVTATLRDHLARGMDDCSFSVVEYGAVPAFVEAGYFAPPTARECVIVGETGTVAADFSRGGGAACTRSRHVPGARGGRHAGGPSTVIAAEGPEPLERELERFPRRGHRGRAFPVGVEAGVLALQVVEAVELVVAARPTCWPERGRPRRWVGLPHSPSGPEPHRAPPWGGAAAAARARRRARFSAARRSRGEVPAESLGQDSMGPASPSSTRERRLAHVLLALWCAFILYGSFIPFQLALGREGLSGTASLACSSSPSATGGARSRSSTWRATCSSSCPLGP